MNPVNESIQRCQRRARKLHERIVRERAALGRWMSRLKRAFHAVERIDHSITRIDRQIAHLENS